MASDRDAAGERALGSIDEALAKRPHKDDRPLAAAVEDLCAWRQSWIARRDAGAWDPPAERALGRLNGVISLVLAIHFPLGDVRWHELEGARAALAALLEEPVAG